MATFEIFIHQLSGQNQFAIGLPVAGQPYVGKKNLIGHCANLLPLPINLQGNMSFSDYLKKRKSELFDAYEHQQLSFGHLLRKLSVARDPSRVPLVPVVFNMDIAKLDENNFFGLTYSLKTNPKISEIFEIFLNVSGSEESLDFEWSFNIDLFKPLVIKEMMESFEDLLRRCILKPNETISNLVHFKTNAYKELNNTQADYSNLPLHKLLEKQAYNTPNRIALKFESEEFTYKNLQEQSNQLAHYLLEKGVSSGDFVGIAIPRSSEMLIALLAIMKCGAAYLPIDPSYPDQRIEFMLRDSKAQYLLSSRKEIDLKNKDFKYLEVEAAFSELLQYSKTAPEIDVNSESIVYIIYTSGSTGKPKGVQINHRNLVNFFYSIADKPGIEKTDKLLAITTISFDIAGIELYLPLLHGACIVLANTESTRDGRLMLKLMKTEEITIMQATPTTWGMLLNTNWEESLKIKALSGGEALPFNLAQRLLSKCDSLWNFYGPTETTIYSTVKQIFKNEDPIYIGGPINNTQLYILDKNQNLLLPGNIGEIAIGGDGVSVGYWNFPELTRKKFIKSSLAPTSTLYLTGDLGVVHPSGEVQCLGRLDHQVKIRGHRIEPEEIENTISEIDNVQNVVVLAHADRLVAHIVPIKRKKTNKEQIGIWKYELDKLLPKYLLPQEYRILETLPMTPNGKLDRKALLNSLSEDTVVPTVNLAPNTKEEIIVSRIWKECLKLDEINIFSDFFELGGHSIMAVQVMTRLENETGKRLPISTLLEYSTIEKLAKFVAAGHTLVSGDSLIPIKPNGNKIPLYLIHGVGLNVRKFNKFINKLDIDQPVFGLQGVGIKNMNRSVSTVEEIAAHYIETITKANPQGPYALAGHSYGGIISYEMAIQLNNNGKKVSSLIMLDTYVEPFFYYSSSIRKTLATLNYQISKKTSVFIDMCKSWDNFMNLLTRKKNHFLNESLKLNNGKTELEELELKHLLELDKENDDIMRKYQIIPQDFEIDLLRAMDSTYFVHDPLFLGWKRAALKGVNIFDVPGDHHNMFSPPNSVIAANVLQRVLDNGNENSNSRSKSQVYKISE